MCAHWIADEHAEARRLLVEALRPRGVWTGHLPELRREPTPLKPLLEQVLNDRSEYVRKAVANCINDISKDQPELVCRWVKRWWTKKMSPERAWVLRRGLRSLLKAGHPAALAIMGFSASAVRVTWDAPIPARITPGDAIPIGLSLVNEGTASDAARVQIVLEAPGRGRSRRRNVYQIAEVELRPGIGVAIEKRIPFRHRNSQPKVPGTYRVLLQINGRDMGSREFIYQE
jgi:3-methyladenine DNA glycosylase AlkC